MILILLACAGGPIWSSEHSLTLGQGTGQDFVPIESGDPVLIVSAPQGGNGMQVRGLTTGLRTNATIDCVMYSIVEGETGASFAMEGIPLWNYPNDEEGTGLFWDAVVPLDPGTWPDAEATTELDGAQAELVVEVIDSAGAVAIAQVAVTLVLD